MSLRRDTLLRAHSLPDSKGGQSKQKPHHPCNHHQPSEVHNDNIEKKLRRRSFFSIPAFTPLRRLSMSYSKKSRSLEGPSPTLKKDLMNEKSSTENPLQNKRDNHDCHDNHDCKSLKPLPNEQDNFIMDTRQNDKELMVSANEFIAKSVLSERTITTQRQEKTPFLTHEDLMEHVKDPITHAPHTNHVLHPDETCTDVCGNHSQISCQPDKPLTTDNSHNILMNKSHSCLTGIPDNNVDQEEQTKLSRNFTLPIRSMHAFGQSPSSARKCVSLENTPVKSHQPRCFSDNFGNRTPTRKFRVYHTKNDSFGQEDYVQALYGMVPPDQNNNNGVVFVPLNSAFYSADCTPVHSTESTPLDSPIDSPLTPNKRHKIFGLSSPKYRKSPVTSPKKSPSKTISPRKTRSLYDPDKESLTGFLFVNLHYGKGFSKNSDTYIILEMDSYGHFFKKAKTKPSRGSDPSWEEAFEFEIEACNNLRLTCYNKLRLMGDDISGKCSIHLTRENLTDNRNHTLSVSLDRGQSILNISLCFSTSIDGIKKSPSFSDTGVFGVPILVVSKREKFDIPVIVISCIKEIEKRGMDEIGIYRLSGVASEIQQLKKWFNEQTQTALLALVDLDIHAVAGLLKLYFRELPQSLFTSKLYRKFVEGLSITDSEEKELYMVDILHQLPKPNKMTALYLFEHLRRVTSLESQNKMGVNNLATVFGPTVLRPPSSTNEKENERSSCNVGTFDIGALDVMSQVGIFRYFLGLKNNERTKLPPNDLELWRRLDVERAAELEEQLMEKAEEHLI